MSETDLVHHYTVLKQFLEISDDLNLRSKSNSSRAVRAREKLFKLSSAQFRELSTDVHDELKRRIDELRGEPDYLLPKSSFHPKRNQARQKLSSLPQSRFKDLVSDISYEIERRGLHEKRDETNSRSSSVQENLLEKSAQTAPKPAPQSDDREVKSHTDDTIPPPYSHSKTDSQTSQGAHDSTEKSIQPQERIHEENETENDEANTSHANQIGIQSTTVVPTKANLAWSSDEEGDDERAIGTSPSKKRQTTHLLTQISAKESLINELRDKLSDAHNDRNTLESNYRKLTEDYEQTCTHNKELRDEIERMQSEKRDASFNNNKEVELRGIGNNDAELDNLRTTNAALRLEIQHLKMAPAKAVDNRSLDNRSLENRGLDNRGLVDSALSTSSKKSTKQDVEAFFEKLSSLDAPKQRAGTDSYADMKKEITTWQTKFEEARSGKISTDLSKALITKTQLKNFLSPSGLISIKLVADFQALVESFITCLREERQDSDILFEKISKISILANEIAIQGENQHINSNEQSIALREAVSYSLTATRYFALYAEVMPKVVVERSVGEVCFTLCDLIKTSKLNEGSNNSRNVKVSSVAAQSAKSPLDEDFGVRPLRMANKLRTRDEMDTSSSSPEARSKNDVPRRLFSDDRGILSGMNSRNASGPSRNVSDGAPMRIAVQIPTSDSEPSTGRRFSESSEDGRKLSDASDARKLSQSSVASRKLSSSSEVGKFPQSSEVEKGLSESSMGGRKLSLASEDSKVSGTNPINSEVSQKSLDSEPITSKNSNVAASTAPSVAYSASSFLRKFSPFATPAAPAVESDSTSQEELGDVLEPSIEARAPEGTEPLVKKTVETKSEGVVSPRRDSPRSKNFAELASKFENGESKDSNVSSPTRNGGNVRQFSNKINSSFEKSPLKEVSNRGSPNGRSAIMNKVKQFESPNTSPIAPRKVISPEEVRKIEIPKRADLKDDVSDDLNTVEESSKIPGALQSNPAEIKSSPSNENTVDGGVNNAAAGVVGVGAGAVGAAAVGASAGVGAVGVAAAGAAAVTGSHNQDENKGRGLFRSIRDRLTSDTDKEQAQEENDDVPPSGQLLNVSDDINNSDEDLNVSTDKMITSTAETTPSKEQESSESVKSEKGFFQSIRDRLTTTTSENNEDVGVQRAPSSTASDATIYLQQSKQSQHDVNSEDETDDANESPLKKLERVDSQRSSNGPTSPLSHRSQPTRSAAPAPAAKKTVTYAPEPESSEEESEEESDDEEETEARQRQEYRKSIAAATFNIDLFDIDDPDNTLTQVLLYLEHQTVQVISTIQSLLSAIKKPDATRGDLREKSLAITVVIQQMTEATNTSMNQTRNAQLKEHGSWVVRSLEDCQHRMTILCKPNTDKKDLDFADKNFKQRLAGISFDIAKCTKELVKTVEEASLKEDIANLDARLQHDLNA